ncbi:MarR family winged helix-turn-helix transcriptional regulator [Phenylobacterium terrae]|uniref:MarR family winged helix-turn-helix transcriptional regulator n=1 Tax=Phenylobacterium terrae TaxID=2665495 RepID=A0ABW4MVL7_9CAUL
MAAIPSPPPPLPEQIYLFVQHLGRRLRDIDLQAGLSPARFSALASLAFHGPANVGELAQFERVSRPAMTRLARDMERAGLIRRRPDPQDRRGVRIEPTARGLALVEAVRTAKIALVAEHLDRLEPALRAQAAAVFGALEDLAEPQGDET